MPDSNPLSLAARSRRTERHMRIVCWVALAWTMLALLFSAWAWFAAT